MSVKSHPDRTAVLPCYGVYRDKGFDPENEENQVAITYGEDGVALSLTCFYLNMGDLTCSNFSSSNTTDQGVSSGSLPCEHCNSTVVFKK